MSEPVVRFFVCHHRPAPYFRNRYFTPIQAGRSVVSTRLDYAAGDDEGDNISSQNPSGVSLRPFTGYGKMSMPTGMG